MRRLILTFALLSGCAGSGGLAQQTSKLNAALEAQYAPLRYEYAQMGDVSRVSTVLAGEVGQTAASEVFQQAILAHIKASCGFDAEALKEVRVVRHQAPVWYEVWVFDPAPRKEGSSGTGVSVVMTYDAGTGITDLSFRGPAKVCS